ncbi:Bacteroides conjugative transposon TraN protein [Mucilaginibacter gossypiicola]|uniref:Bacteroides conjugative transposon TraN protein n=1 Tax=Mucilaginibacter gossypiicola TaxID=551995 RepID=A0A1H8AX91_9SPHI|nr:MULTISPECIES: DUF4138 domain-containing protein [Mucilaginibacter]UOE52215.1 DUF4138 domain-containing protein [Mucilaginibacter sp. SMC90]SEM75285.1 Bacteroides conjugative transposon TraN protein [Mucilaginibacter gossypiicola]
MKNFLFTLAAIFIAALHSYAQKINLPEGTRKSDLPVVYLPDSLSVHFISPEPIQYVDISSKSIVGDLPVKNVLRIRYRSDSSKIAGREAIVTIAGEKFLAQYRIEWSASDGGAIQSEIEIQPSETRPLDIGVSLSQPELKRLSTNLLCFRPEANLRHAKAFDIKARLNHVYTFGDYIFLDLGYVNRSKLSYEIDNFRFTIEDQKVTKASTVQALEIKPEFILFEQTQFARHYRNIFVFKKFTFPGNKLLRVELNEKQLSGRVISLHIPYKDILNADIIPSVR